MSLLTLIQDVSKLIGLESPTAVTTSQDKRVLELLVMANATGEELSTRYEWQELIRQASFTCTGTIAQGTIDSSTIASGFGRIVDDTFWNFTTREKIEGPVTFQEWQSDRASGIVSPPYKSILIDNVLYVGPVAPAAGGTLGFFYVLNGWCRSSGGTVQTAFAADTDTTLIPERLFKYDLVWRWKQSKGLAYSEDMETAEREIEKYIGQNTGRRVLYIGGAPIYYFADNVPAGNWPSS